MLLSKFKFFLGINSNIKVKLEISFLTFSFYDEDRQSPYMVSADGKEWFSYDDSRSIAVKLAWVSAQGYGGAFFWNLDLDDFDGTGNCPGADPGLAYPLVSQLSTLGSSSPPVVPRATTRRRVPTRVVKTTTPKATPVARRTTRRKEPCRPDLDSGESATTKTESKFNFEGF